VRWSVDLAAWTPPAPEALAATPALADEGEDAESSEALVLAARDVLALAPEQRRERLEAVRRQLESLGEVNLGAIEEHEELGERFRFLSEQKADLEASVASLRDAIARINRTSRKRFRETFDAVNERFQQNFPRLFRGGKANLVLAETEDVLEAGVDIAAQPPGKRLQNVNLLSGGEKTLTAIALLISLFQVRPSPFFLLDEVDAALDDANVGRFNEIVREMAKESQFLVITHNKRTIEIADVLYGVTMEEKGVSKLVAVELH
jgi:chromosome segregation protein